MMIRPVEAAICENTVVVRPYFSRCFGAIKESGKTFEEHPGLNFGGYKRFKSCDAVSLPDNKVFQKMITETASFF
jgi:hypothetical protein